MAKVPLLDVGSLGNPSSARQNINENNERIENAFDGFLSRDGSAPNNMEADLDVGGFRLLNVADPVNDNDGVNRRSIGALVDEFAQEIISKAVFGEIVVDTYVATASQTVFVLSQAPGSIQNTEVYVAGAAKRPTTDYVLSGENLKTLTFLAPLTAGQAVLIRYARALPSGTTTADAVTYTAPDGFAGSVKDRLDAFAQGTGASLVGYKHPASGTVARTLLDKASERLTPQDFMSTAQRTDVASNTGSLNVQAALQAACDYLYGIGGGDLFLPPGVYRLTSPLVVKNGVRIIGSGCVPYKTPAETRPRGGGSWLFLDHSGVGLDVVATPEAVGSGAVLRDFGTFRTHATPAPGWTPTVYDWDIQNAGMDLLIEDVTLLNCYKGVRIYSAGFGRLQMNRVYMQAFHTGVYLELSNDVCRLRDCHIWPFWSDHAAVRAYTLANTTGYKVQRADSSVLDGCLTIFLNKGLEFTGDGSTQIPYRIRVDNCYLDIGTIGAYFGTGASNGMVMFANTVFLQENAQPSYGIVVDSSNLTITGTNCEIADCARNSIDINGSGNNVRFSTLTCRSWNAASAGYTAIDVASGNKFVSDGPVNFAGSGSTNVYSGAGVIDAPLGGGSVSANTNSSGDVTVNHTFRVQPSEILLQATAGSNFVHSIVGNSNTSFTIRTFIADTGAAAPAGYTINCYYRGFMH